jgi:hypothetical protein
MFKHSTIKIDSLTKNIIIKKNLHLDSKLDCFIQISTNDDNYWDLILNNIIDTIIKKISKKNTYDDFSNSLSKINIFLSTLLKNNTQKLKFDIIISILNKKTFLFSNIWKSSCFLINKKNDLIELTNNKENETEFNFVSSWDLENNEIIILSNCNLLKYLSKSDILDGIIISRNFDVFNKNIKNILENEILKQNIIINTIQFNKKNITSSDNLDNIKNNFIYLLDNKLSKTIIWYCLAIKDIINRQTKSIKNILFILTIIFSVFLLYNIINTTINTTSTKKTEIKIKNNINLAKEYIKKASININNPIIFSENIKKTTELINSSDNNIFSHDIELIKNQIDILKNEFNKVNIIKYNEQNYILKTDITNPIKIIQNNKKQYIITNKIVIWPIIQKTKLKKHSFNELWSDEFFVDASFIWNNLFLLTNKSNIIKFTNSWYFNYMDVRWQKLWEESKQLASYSKNIYLLWNSDSQINRHTLSWTKFNKAKWYLKKDDLSQIWEILSVAIDGWIYILKKDLSIIKFFSYPYRIEKLIINKLPDNYNIEKNSKIELKARLDLNYVYLLMNNKIWIFKPNTTNYRNTKQLTYLWQIDWWIHKIKNFYVDNDWEIIILNNKWLYKIDFEISDNKLILR